MLLFRRRAKTQKLIVESGTFRAVTSIFSLYLVFYIAGCSTKQVVLSPLCLTTFHDEANGKLSGCERVFL